MIIVSVDPGFVKLGVAVQKEVGGEKVLDYADVWELRSKYTKFNNKLNDISRQAYHRFSELLDAEEGGEETRVVWEVVPSFGAMSQREIIQGVVSSLRCATWNSNLKHVCIQSNTWKKMVMGSAKVTKEQTKDWVLDNTTEGFIKVDGIPYDAYDAIAIGRAAYQLSETDWWK